MVGIAFAGSSCGLGGRPGENKALKKHKEIRVAICFPIRPMIAEDTRELGRGSPTHILPSIHLSPSTTILFYLFLPSASMETLPGVIVMRERVAEITSPSLGQNKKFMVHIDSSTQL